MAVGISNANALTGQLYVMARFAADTPAETTLISAGVAYIYTAQWEPVEEQADAFLSGLRTGETLRIDKGQDLTRKIALFGDGDTLPRRLM